MINLLVTGNIVMIASFILRLKTLPPQIPLLYSRPLGETQLVDTWMIFLIPFVLNILYTANNYLENRFFSSNDLVKKIFGYLNLFLIVVFTLIFVKIIFLIS